MSKLDAFKDSKYQKARSLCSKKHALDTSVPFSLLAISTVRVPCRNQDLKRRNADILYSVEEVPTSDYSEAVKSLKETRIRDFNVISPVEQRLDVPGKIIHLVHVDRSDKYLPYW